MEQQQNQPVDWENMPEVQKAAMWARTSKNGVQFLSGVVEINGVKHKLALFTNSYKQAGDKQPDWQFSKKEDSNVSAQPAQQAPAASQQQAPANTPVNTNPVQEGTIPPAF